MEIPTPDVMSSSRVFTSLLAEVPPETIVLKTMRGKFTAQNIIDDLNVGGDIGRQYISDVLRVIRDQLIRSAKKDKT